MQIVEAIQESPRLARNGAGSLDSIRSDVDAVLGKARDLNLAVWELVFQTKDQFVVNLEQVLKPRGETWTALADVRDAWSDLTGSVEGLRQDVLPPASS